MHTSQAHIGGSGRCVLLLISLLLLLCVGFGSSRSLREEEASFDIEERMKDITSRKTWKHAYLWPQKQLAKGMHVVGDDSRLKKFMEKIIRGIPVKYTHMGGSISTSRGAPLDDMQWWGTAHKWLELTFTDCGKMYWSKTARDHSEEWTKHSRTVCNSSNIEYVNAALGATSCVWAEKCLLGSVAQDVDLVVIEYTVNALDPANMGIATMERRPLERMLRKILLMPKAPAILMIHTVTGFDFKEDEAFARYAPHPEDIHNLLLNYYGNIQALSIRQVVFDVADKYKDRLADLQFWDMPPLGQICHPERTGVAVYQDIYIHFWQRLAKQVMSEMLTEKFIPSSVVPQQAEPRRQKVYESSCRSLGYECQGVMSGPVLEYIDKVVANPKHLPRPLIPDNWENSDGFCVTGQQLSELYRVHMGSWELKGDSPGGRSRKWGYTGTKVGDVLQLKIDSTISGHVKAGNLTLVEQIHDNDGIVLNVTKGLTEVMIGYLRTYEDIGEAEVTCVSGCRCDHQHLQGWWEHKNSQPFYHRMYVTPSEECVIQIQILASTKTNSNRFKISGLIASQRPFHYATLHSGSLSEQLP